MVLYIGCSGPVIGSLIATYCLNLDPRYTGTMPSTTQILRTSTKRCASPQLINRIHATHFIHILIRILHYVIPINHN